MELFFWLWFYDSQFFFNIKTSLQFYKNSWIIPIVAHIFVCFVCMYYLFISEKNECNEAFRIWQTLKFFISFIFMALLIYFVIYINSYEEEEKKKYKNVKRVIKGGKTVNDRAGEWIRRKTLVSSFGVLILFLGVLYFFGSLFMMCIYEFDLHDVCDQKLRNLLFWQSLFVILTNSPAIIMLLIMLFTKCIPMILSAINPSLPSKMRQTGNCCKKSPADMNKYIKDYSP